MAGRAAAEGEVNTITLLPEDGGAVGAISVSNDAGTQVLDQPFQTTQIASIVAAPSQPVIATSDQLSQLYGDISSTLPAQPVLRQRTDDGQATEASDTGDDGGAAAEEAVEEGEEEGDEEGGESEEELEEGEEE